MLLGTFEAKLIGKNRLVLPSKLRKEINGDRLILSIGFESCIFGFSEKKWEEVTAVDLAKPLFSDSGARDLRRKMFSKAAVVELDSHNRFVVPEGIGELEGIGDIGKKMIFIGAGDHFEIWETKKWEEYSRKLE